MRVYYPVYAELERDAIDKAERRARDAGHTVKRMDSTQAMDPDRTGLRLWIVWLTVDEPKAVL